MAAYCRKWHRCAQSILFNVDILPAKKILVIGCPGSGKSTFARKLRDVTGLPLYYLDMVFHRPDRSTASRAEFDAALAEILAKDEWIIDGNYLRTLPRRLRACGLVFFFDLPVDDCLHGAASRIGKPREDLPWVETEFDAEFLQYIKDFPKDQLPEIKRLLAEFAGAGGPGHASGGRLVDADAPVHGSTTPSVITFTTRTQADKYIANLRRLVSI